MLNPQPAPWWERDLATNMRHRFEQVPVGGMVRVQTSCGKTPHQLGKLVGPVDGPTREECLRAAPSAWACAFCMEAEVYPQHAILRRLKGANQVVGDFLSWLEQQGLVVCRDTGRVALFAGLEELPVMVYERDPRPISALIASWAGIDQDALDAEKGLMLDTLRKAQQR